MNIQYVSSGKSPSGYGSASRADIMALYVAGVNVSCQTIQQTAETTDYGLEGKLMQELEGRKIPYKIKLIHLTPDIIPDYKEDGVYTISRLAWETDRLPKEWVEPLNKCDEIWTMSSQMAEMIHSSGVNTLCTVIPEPVNTMYAEEEIEPFLIPTQRDFVFYTIGQWIERKNMRGLIRAYWREFTGEQNVSLLIKTYRMNYASDEWAKIKQEIEVFRRELKLDHYPKILLVKSLLTEDQMWKLHAVGDVYVNPSSGEGWARPLAEAMALGKPCISGDNGGITDYMSTYYHVASNEEPVIENPHIPWYSSPQKWKTLDEKSLQRAMRSVFTDFTMAQKKGKQAQKFVVDNFSYQEVGSKMKKRLEEIVL
ncbi:MAG TPA: glycosyltransferase [Patescibacteria group bacterium]